MDRASFAWQPAAHSSMPMGYELDGAPVSPYVYPVHAAGGLLANVEDIARFVSAGAMTPTSTGNAVLAPQSRSQLYAPVVPIPGLFGVVADSYGFGHFVETLPNGRQAVWHGGQGHGWTTHFHLVPETGDGIVILSNSQRSWPLIAQTLQDWAAWSGNGAVKFSHITTATMVLQAIVVALGVVALWLAARLGQGLRRGTRRLAPLAPGGRYRRLLQFLVGVGVIAVLTWSISRPYRDFTSIFPTTAVWADATFLILALLLILSAILPPTYEGTK
jgi:CubicO group peptidase (beta-lactamase class C family)